MEQLDEMIVKENQSKTLKKLKVLIGILIGLSIILAISVIILLVTKKENNIDPKEKEEEQKKKEEEEKQKKEYEMYLSGGLIEEWYDIYGNRTSNITYDEDGVIKNTFGKGGINYNEEIGNINNGSDYPKNERNIYDLYIPYSLLERKDKHNGIFLFIHGGGWTKGDKNGIDSYLPKRYAKMGFITASIGYTLLIDQYKPYNIFRIIDEISACLRSIKRELANQGFNENKLELALGGISAGGHLATLYPYILKKNSPIPPKFIINLVGPMGMESKYFYKAKDKNNIIDNIETEEQINEGIKDGKLIPIFENELLILGFLDIHLGFKYSLEELKEMLDENSKIKTDNEKYKELFKSASYGFPYHYLNDDEALIPIICEYGGNDIISGVANYYTLHKVYKEKNKDILLIYNKYAGHELFHWYTEEGYKAMKEQHYQIMNFAKKYFTND